MKALDPQLEAMLREDPFDDAYWMVLEDWLLEHDDPRAQIVLFEKEGDRTAARAARDRMLPALLGTDELAFAGTWRAGFVQEARIAVGERGPAPLDVLATLLAAPAGRFLRQLTIDITAPADLAALTAALAAAPALRMMTLTARWTHARDAVLDLGIERLFLLGAPVRLARGPHLARLRSLVLTPGHPEDLAFARGALPNLRELGINVATLDARHRAADEAFAHLLAGAATPALDQLHVDDASALLARRLFDALARSPLLAQLHSLALGDTRVEPADFGAPFAHLEILALPHALIGRAS